MPRTSQETNNEEVKLTPKQKATRLMRVHLINNNPNKQELDGEVITIVSPTFSKISRFVPFNKESTHIEYALYCYLKGKKYNIPVKTKTPSGKEKIELKELPEYTITDLPPLTQKELEELAKAQRIRETEENGK